MRVNNTHYRTVWMTTGSVFLIEQNLLPFSFQIHQCHNHLETCHAIKTMIVRGAGAIGSTAGYAMAQAFLQAPATSAKEFVIQAKKDIEATRPTARNLFYAVDRVFSAGQRSAEEALAEAERIAEEDVEACRLIGEYGNQILGDTCAVETHCNAGWLAFTDFGSAIAPIYTAASAGKKVFVYVDETRPRSQGARLTAWELANEQIPHTIIADNAGAFLMSQGKIDCIIVGADRIAANGDVANKIGTLEKAIVAKEYGVPFYVAAPHSTFDANCPDGSHIPIEERGQEEVLMMEGPDAQGMQHVIQVCSPGSTGYNPAFDVTPARFIAGLITNRGIIQPNREAIAEMLRR